MLTAKGSKLQLRTDQVFAKSREVLAARRIELTKLGKGNKPNACRALTESEVTSLFDKGYFGRNHPLNLQRAVWYVFTVSFGYRARQESRALQFGDVKVGIAPSGKRHLVWDTEHGTKTRTGEKPMGH